MKRLATLILMIGLLAPALSGCFHNQIVVQDNYNSSQTEPDWNKGWNTWLLWGLVPVGENPIDVTEACPQGAGIVEVKKTFLNSLLGGFTFGIVGWQETNVYCAKGAADNALEHEPLAAN